MVVSNQLFPKSHNNIETSTSNAFTIPEYEGEPFAVINQNIPFFEKDDYTTESFENYSELDVLGRCGVCRPLIHSYNSDDDDYNYSWCLVTSHVPLVSHLYMTPLHRVVERMK